jgi:hypothetical protein
MMTIMLKFLFLVICIFSAGNSQAVESGALAPDFTLTDTDGVSHQLSDFAGKIVVLEWVNYDCPFVVKHYKSGNMQSLQKTYTDQGVIWLSINSSAAGKQGAYNPEEVKEIMANSAAEPTAYLFDTTGDVGRIYGAKTTPHMYIIGPEGHLVYQGAIDDKPSFDLADVESARNYVSESLDALLAGENVEVSATQSYGCSVKY